MVVRSRASSWADGEIASFAELIDLLNLLAIDDETISISRITEIKIVPDTPRAHLCVRLELLPMDKDLESSLQTRQSMSRLRSIDLELKYTQSKSRRIRPLLVVVRIPLWISNR
ncbi:hypothetical protein KEM48_006106 [Puccinia striiformis f. sp. tritici PST-130]|nr:hypothetical protein KEM48_006106 [Puccinia striiformis f. sp. tritici PST-130]